MGVMGVNDLIDWDSLNPTDEPSETPGERDYLATYLYKGAVYGFCFMAHRENRVRVARRILHSSTGMGLDSSAATLTYVSDDHEPFGGDQARCPVCYRVVDVVERWNPVAETLESVFEGHGPLMRHTGGMRRCAGSWVPVP